jgi:hypothetical protein
MKAQAKEEKARKQVERDKLAREKELKEEALKDKEELQRKLNHLQDELRLGQDALVSNHHHELPVLCSQIGIQICSLPPIIQLLTLDQVG